jgi:hypothetical protein
MKTRQIIVAATIIVAEITFVIVTCLTQGMNM